VIEPTDPEWTHMRMAVVQCSAEPARLFAPRLAGEDALVAKVAEFLEVLGRPCRVELWRCGESEPYKVLEDGCDIPS
jgi:hypothetical protein